MRMILSRLHFPVTTLGPGRRIGVWFQGCSIRCAGCISRDTWETGEGEVEVAEVIAELGRFAGEADGLTVSGGEPFDQPQALTLVLAAWRQMSKRPVLVFTGLERAEVDEWLAANSGLVDALVTGPFRSDLPQTMALRGSDNQELHILSPAGEASRAFERPATSADRRLDVMFDEEGHAWFAGIPARGDFAKMRRALATAGHHAITSDMAGVFAA